MKEDLFHTVDLSIARRPECRVWIGIHFAEGEVLQVAGFREVFEPDLVSALASLGFEWVCQLLTEIRMIARPCQ